jgi:hypothetical protein
MWNVIGVNVGTLGALAQGTASYRLTDQQEFQLACGVVILAVLALQFRALILYRRDQRFLRELIDRIASHALPPSEQVKCIVASLGDKPFEHSNKFFLASIFRFLRPTPRQVAESGGSCSDRSRLIVALLHLRGIGASKWAIYSPDQVPCHAVVEVETESGKMVVDPSFGLWFPRPGGGYYGVEDLRKHPELLLQRIQELLAKGSLKGLGNLEFYPLDKYVFTHARTINWDKNWLSRLLYRLLHRVMGTKVNETSRPAWAEQPALMIIYTGLLVELLFLTSWLIQSNAFFGGRPHP